MAEKMITTFVSLSLLSLFLPRTIASPNPVPAPWPLQFHSLQVFNTSGQLQVTDLWYDWPNGRNFNIIQNQLGEKLYDLEWDNGTSFYYTLDANRKCRTLNFSVGILRPNFLEDANYTGQQLRDGFLCNVWEKVDFIQYYEDVVTKRPVGWDFYTGMRIHVMTFEVGEVLDEPNWQAPVYCFGGDDVLLESSFGLNSVMGIPNPLNLGFISSLFFHHNK